MFPGVFTMNSVMERSELMDVYAQSCFCQKNSMARVDGLS